MKGFLAATMSLAAIIGIGCAHKELNPGRCNSNNDCPSGQTCDLSPQANGTCVCASPGCIDGSAGAGAGGAAGVGGTSGSGGMAGAGGMPDGGAGTGGCQPACAAPKGICVNSTCVECVTSADCATSTKPICDATTNTCVPCTSDDQCIAKVGADPGVCMSHQDGRCATVSETIYVQDDTTICSDTATSDPGFGTAMKPLCSMQPVAGLLSAMASKDLVILRGMVQAGSWTYMGQATGELSLVGQSKALIAAGTGPAFATQSGPLFMRDIELSRSATGVKVSGGTVRLQNVTIDNCADGIDISFGATTLTNGVITNNSAIGINATGGTLNLTTATVDRCAGGGILLDGAAFDIENTTITNNGPSSDLSWGGVKVQTLPSTGSAVFHLVTIQKNSPSGMSCAQGATVQADGVLASGNSSGDISPTCGITNCQTAGPSCGAQ